MLKEIHSKSTLLLEIFDQNKSRGKSKIVNFCFIRNLEFEHWITKFEVTIKEAITYFLSSLALSGIVMSLVVSRESPLQPKSFGTIFLIKNILSENFVTALCKCIINKSQIISFLFLFFSIYFLHKKAYCLSHIKSIYVCIWRRNIMDVI